MCTKIRSKLFNVWASFKHTRSCVSRNYEVLKFNKLKFSTNYIHYKKAIR